MPNDSIEDAMKKMQDEDKARWAALVQHVADTSCPECGEFYDDSDDDECSDCGAERVKVDRG